MRAADNVLKNTYTAVAQDDYGRAATNTVSVTLPAPGGYTYDLNGNLLADGARNFAYDDENRLTSVWQSSFIVAAGMLAPPAEVVKPEYSEAFSKLRSSRRESAQNTKNQRELTSAATVLKEALETSLF